jgi:predicted metal-binding membrane protein
MEFTNNLPRRDTLVISFCLGGITLLSWLTLFSMANDMAMPPGFDMIMKVRQWNSGYFVMMFLMWAIMMVGMMIPSVAPTVMIYAAVEKKAIKQGMPIASTSVFVAGYIAIWTLFSLVATTAQWGLDQAALLSPMMVSNSAYLGAGLLIAAGIYQWLPLKESCLRQCRSPVEFISTHMRQGTLGALRMGIDHGLYCLGCCWVLMCLLFVGGVMNLLWIAIITLFVLLEKILPAGQIGGRVMGVIMILSGGVFIFNGN